MTEPLFTWVKHSCNLGSLHFHPTSTVWKAGWWIPGQGYGVQTHPDLYVRKSLVNLFDRSVLHNLVLPLGPKFWPELDWASDSQQHSITSEGLSLSLSLVISHGSRARGGTSGGGRSQIGFHCNNFTSRLPSRHVFPLFCEEPHCHAEFWVELHTLHWRSEPGWGVSTRTLLGVFHDAGARLSSQTEFIHQTSLLTVCSGLLPAVPSPGGLIVMSFLSRLMLTSLWAGLVFARPLQRWGPHLWSPWLWCRRPLRVTVAPAVPRPTGGAAYLVFAGCDVQHNVCAELRSDRVWSHEARTKRRV